MRFRYVLILLAFLSFHFISNNSTIAENQNEILIQCEVDGNRCVQLLSYQDSYRIRLLNNRYGVWRLDSETDLIEFHNITPSISIKNELLYIHYTEQEYYVYKPNEDNVWVLSFFYFSSANEGDISLSFFDYGIFIVEETRAHIQRAYWLFGKPSFPTELERFTPSFLPKSIHMLYNIIDTSDWGIVNCSDRNEISFYERPDCKSRMLGSFFHGAPVRIIDQQADWVYVRIAEYYGWLPKSSIKVENEMLEAVPSAIDHLHLKAVAFQEEAPIYQFPSANADVSFRLCKDKNLVFEKSIILGVIDEEWYMIWTPNGVEGFIQACWVTEGNG